MDFLDKLKQVYEPELIILDDNKCAITEKLNSSVNTLQKVEIQNCGKCFLVKEKWLASGQDKYRNNGVCHLRRICDGVLYFEKDGEKFLSFIELKSSRKEVFKTGIFKFPVCYYRTRLCFNSFEGVDLSEIKTFGLILYPCIDSDRVSAITQNEGLMEQKMNVVHNRLLDDIRIRAKYERMVKDKEKVSLEGADFGVDKLPLKTEYKMMSLDTVIWPVSCPIGVIDINEVLEALHIA